MRRKHGVGWMLGIAALLALAFLLAQCADDGGSDSSDGGGSATASVTVQVQNVD